MSKHREIIEACGHMKRLIERIEECAREYASSAELSRVQELAGIQNPQEYNSEFENLEEKWGVSTTVSPSEKGKYKGKSLADLRSSLAALKKSGPHKQGSPEFGRMRELQFAIRAKTGWGKVKD